jgi:hypothetical protein
MSFGVKPKSVLSLALLQILSALMCFVMVILTFMSLGINWESMLTGGVYLFTFLVLGIISLILSFGLWTMKRWAWVCALLVNIIGILGVILLQPESYIHWWYWDTILVGIPNGRLWFRE